MKIFVTGGAGFIGRHLVDFLLVNHQVTIFDNLSSSSKSDISSVLKKGANFQVGDILDYPALKKSCKGFDVVIHLAAKSNVFESIQNPEITYEVNVKGTKNILNSCKENKINKLIFASSAAVYGNCNLTINETTPPIPLSPYGKSKLDAEKQIESFAKLNDINAISLRMFNVYDLHDKKQSGVVSKFIKNVTKEEPIVINGDGKQTRDFIFIDDVIHAFDCALNHIMGKRGRVYNIASGNSFSIEELAKIIITKSRKKIKIKFQELKSGDIKKSKPSVKLAEKEIGFVARHKLVEDLCEFFQEMNTN